MVERFECDFSLARKGVRSLDRLNPENPMLDIDITVLDELVESLNSGGDRNIGCYRRFLVRRF